MKSQNNNSTPDAFESEARYRALLSLSSVTDYIYTVMLQDGEPVATIHSAGCVAVTGYTQAEYARDPFLWFKMIYPQDRAAVSAQIARVLAGQTVPPIEHRLLHKDGSLRWVRNTSVLRHDDQERLVAYDGLVSDITPLKRAEEELAYERDLLHSLMDNIPDTIYFKDAASRFTRVNAAQARVLGIARPEDALGKTDFDFFAREHASQAYADEQDILRTGQPLINKVEKLARRDGTFIRWVTCTKIPFQDKNGQVIGTVGISRDITDMVAAEESLRQSAHELQARNEELDAFAHTVAHDLKHSLSVIIGLSETLESEAGRAALPPAELDDLMRRLALRARKMDNIIEELMLLSNARRADQVQTYPLDMVNIVAQVQEQLADLIQEHQARITAPRQWPFALGYTPWIEQVWINYISNAVKYGGRPPQIALGAAREPNGMVRYWVQDNGPGLTPQEREGLFTPFTRLNQVRARGHGLGLSIVRRIVERLGGQVRVASEPGQGSTFSFTLPDAETTTR